MTNDNLDIVLNPSELSEAASQTAVVTFGRMNPPTVGHLALVKKMLEISQQKQAKPLIFLSHSVDSKKNPLSYNDKAKLINMAFGRIVQKSNAKNIFDMLKELSGNYENLVIVVGSDRVKDLKRISTTYNGKDFNFKNIEVVSAGTRDPDSDGVTGMSATKMRDAAAKNDLQAFKRGLPDQLNKNAAKILKMVREGMNLKEDLDNIFEEHLEEAGVLTVAGRRKKAIAARRYKARLKVARKRVSRRLAQTGRIKKRTARAAIRVMRNRLAGSRGKSYSKLSPIEKSSIDKRVRQRGNIVKKLATRIMPVTRRKEFERFKSFRSRKESMDMAFSSYLTENNHKEVKPIQEKVLNSIIKKSIIAEIPVNILSEVYNKYSQRGDSFAFNRLNEFINKNRTSDMDEVFEAFIAELSTNTLISYRDKAIKDASGKHRDAQRAYDGGNYNRADAKLKSAQKRVASMNTATDKIQDKIQKKKKTLIGKPVSEEQQMQEIAQDSTINHMLTPAKNVKVVKKNVALEGKKPGLWDNIHAKRKRIKGGSKERMRAPGSKGAPSKQDFRDASESVIKNNNDGLSGPAYGRPSGGYTGDKIVHGQKGYKEYMAYAKKRKAELAAKKNTAESYISELDTDTIKSAHDKRKKQEFDASYKADTYGSEAQRADTKQGEKNKRGLQNQQRKKQDKASKGMALANRALKRKGYKMGGASDYRLHDTNYDQRRADEKSGKLKEEGGAGLMGTNDLLRRYVHDTPGQTPSTDLAIDGVPGKGGMIPKQQPLKGLGQNGKFNMTSYKDYLNAKKS